MMARPPVAARRRCLTRFAALAGAPALAALAPWAASRAAEAPLVTLYGKPPSSRPQRLFAAGPPAGVLLAVLAPERLLGWPTTFDAAARTLLPPAARDKPTLGRLLGRGSTIGAEALLAHQPDLIVDAGAVDATYRSMAQRVAEQTGLPYALVDGRLVDTPRQLREAGALLGVEPARVQALAAYAEAALAQSAALHTGARPGVYLARSATGLETAPLGSINSEFIEAAGGRNVAVGRAGVASVSMEQVLGWAPDWIVTQDRSFYVQAQRDALWRALPAVREGRLLLAPDRPFGWTDVPPGVNRLLGLRWLAASFARGRPDTAAAIDEALHFYALFYGVTPARETIAALLDGRA